MTNSSHHTIPYPNILFPPHLTIPESLQFQNLEPGHFTLNILKGNMYYRHSKLLVIIHGVNTIRYNCSFYTAPFLFDIFLKFTMWVFYVAPLHCEINHLTPVSKLMFINSFVIIQNPKTLSF